MLLFEKKNTEKEIELLAENLNLLLTKNNVDVKTLHKHTGISIPSINALRRGEGNPTLETLLALSKFFNISINELISTNHQSIQKKPISIPLYTLNDFASTDMPKNTDIINVEYDELLNDDSFAIELHNNALSPFYEKGAIFIISAGIAYSDGDIAFIKFNSKKYGFRKIFLQSNLILTKMLTTEDQKPTILDKGEILGIVIKVIQNLR